MIFVDTGAFIARFIQEDQHHAKATQVWETLYQQKQKLYTSNFVIDELITFLMRKTYPVYALEKANLIYHSGVLQVLRPDQQNELVAVEYLNKYKDKTLSFTDAVSFALMKANKIKRYFGFDQHFQMAGFEAFLE